MKFFLLFVFLLISYDVKAELISCESTSNPLLVNLGSNQCPIADPAPEDTYYDYQANGKGCYCPIPSGFKYDGGSSYLVTSFNRTTETNTCLLNTNGNYTGGITQTQSYTQTKYCEVVCDNPVPMDFTVLDRFCEDSDNSQWQSDNVGFNKKYLEAMCMCPEEVEQLNFKHRVAAKLNLDYVSSSSSTSSSVTSSSSSTGGSNSSCSPMVLSSTRWAQPITELQCLSTPPPVGDEGKPQYFTRLIWDSCALVCVYDVEFCTMGRVWSTAQSLCVEPNIPSNDSECQGGYTKGSFHDFRTESLAFVFAPYKSGKCFQDYNCNSDTTVKKVIEVGCGSDPAQNTSSSGVLNCSDSEYYDLLTKTCKSLTGSSAGVSSVGLPESLATNTNLRLDGIKSGLSELGKDIRASALQTDADLKAIKYAVDGGEAGERPFYDYDTDKLAFDNFHQQIQTDFDNIQNSYSNVMATLEGDSTTFNMGVPVSTCEQCINVQGKNSCIDLCEVIAPHSQVIYTVTYLTSIVSFFYFFITLFVLGA